MKNAIRLFTQSLLAALVCLSLFSNLVQAQMRVGQPAGSPDGSAALEVNGGPYSSGSLFRGIAPPKVALTSSSSASPVTTPVTGLLIYNTAKAGDVTPGYYYWDGSRWLRFNTTSGSPSARQMGNGQTIPAYLLNEVSGIPSTVDNFFLVEPGREGLFSSDASLSSGQANGGTVLASSYKVYRRVISGLVNVRWFGAKGDGTNDDTQAFQNAINTSKKVYVPNGYYKITSSLIKNNTGSLLLEGESTDAYLAMTADMDLIQFTSNGSGGGTCQISNLTLYASTGTTMATGAAINIKGGYVTKVAHLDNIRISRPDYNNEFKYGIRVENPNETVIENVIISGNNAANLIGVELTATQAAVSPTLTNVKVYDANIGCQIISKSNRGLEGLKFRGCDFVGVQMGIDAANTYGVTYIPPGFQVHQSHFNAYQGGIRLKNYTQGDISECIFYGSGTGFMYGVDFENVGDMSVQNNRFYRVNTGNMYGVLLNSGSNENDKINFNHFYLNPSGGESAIWFGNSANYCQALYNTVIGLSSGYAVYDSNFSSTTNTSVGNTKR